MFTDLHFMNRNVIASLVTVPVSLNLGCVTVTHTIQIKNHIFHKK